MATYDPQDDPLTTFKFNIEIEGIIEGGFTECKGLQIQWKVEKFREGGVNQFEYQRPKHIKAAKVKLSNGMAYSETLWRWFETGFIDGKVDYRNVSIIMFDNDYTEKRRWNLQNAFPLKWKAPDLKAKGKETAIETLELAFHGITMEMSG